MNQRFALLLFALLVLSLPAAGQEAAKMTDADCLGCHTDATLTKEVKGKQVSVHVDEAKFKASIHGSMFGCADCHADVKAYPHDPTPKKPTCATCHEEAVQKFARSLHATAKKEGNGSAPNCASCHGNLHYVLPSADPNSATSHNNIPKTCESCHADVKVAQTNSGLGRSAEAVASYDQSVHGKAVAGGNEKAAVCTDCHNSHEVLNGAHANSPINKFNIPRTCGKCHADASTAFLESVHGQAIKKGRWQSPVCSDCHGIHNIKKAADPNAPTSPLRMAENTCGQCHESVRLTAELGIGGNRVSNYRDSYHGLASQLGGMTMANCGSCHGVHKVLPSRDARSTIHPMHLQETCGQCHQGATARFAASKVHIDSGDTQSADIGTAATSWVRRIYMGIIFGTIGMMLLHNLLLWRRRAIQKRLARNRVIVRMSRVQRVQHWLLLLSFFALVLSGFALAYPETWLGLLFYNELMRRWAHRAAAVVMMGVGAYHLYYLAATAEGRRLFLDFLPQPKDGSDAAKNLAYALGRSSTKPRFGRFSYADKAEYWALVWGTLVMAVTGLMLWFNVEVSYLAPRWVLDIASAIHFYEAILAFLAILVWHFYFVIFDPDTYPINWAFYDGKITPDHLAHHHPLQYEEWVKEQKRLAADAGEDTETPEDEAESDTPATGDAKTGDENGGNN